MKEKEEAEYKDMVQNRMSQLKDEVNMNIEDFLQTSKDLKQKTEQRAQTLEKIKKKYNHLKKKKAKLQHKMLKKAEDEALVEATETVE